MGKQFVTANVSLLAGLAALSGLRMTFTRRSSTWARHSLVRLLVVRNWGKRADLADLQVIEYELIAARRVYTL